MSPFLPPLVQNADGTYTLTAADHSQELFSSAGLETTSSDPTGNQTLYSYNADHSIAQIAAPGDMTTTFAYVNGLISTITDFAGRVTTFEHDAAGHITEILRPAPGYGEQADNTTMTYDPATGLMLTLTDASGTTSYAYDWSRSVSSITAPDGTVTHYTSPEGLVNLAGGLGTQANPAPLVYSNNLQGTQTDPNGHTSAYTVGQFGQITSTTDALGNTVSYVLNAEGQTIEMDQPPLTVGGQPLKTFYQYDNSGNLVEEDLPDGTKQLWTYDPTWNEPVKYIDQQGLETDYTLDPANGNILSVTQVSAADGNRTTSYQYTPAPAAGSNDPPAGLVAKEFDPLGHETDISYDKHGLVTQITYAVGTSDQAHVSFTYDANLNLASETDELGRTTLVTMDNLDRLVETQLPPPDPAQPNVYPTTTQVWSGSGLFLQETDALGRVTTHHYSATGKEVELDQPDPAGGNNLTITRNTFDPAGNLISTTDPMSRVSSQLFNALNQVVTVQQPNPANGGATGGPASSVVYNALGDVVQEIDPAGNVTDNSYDVSGDLLSTTGPAPTPGAARPTVSYTYSPDGEVLSSTDALGNVSQFQYDDFGELVREQEPSPDGHTPGPVLTWSYDQDGNQLSAVDGNGNETDFLYNARDEQIETIEPSPDGVAPRPTVHFQYDLAGELVEVTDELNRVTQYVYNGDALQTQVILPNPVTGGAGDATTTTTDQFDLNGNLISETNSAGATTQFFYDGLDNKVKEIDPAPSPGMPAPTTTWTYDADSELVQTIDPMGRSSTSTLDGLGRTVASTSFTGQTTQYAYDVLSNLVSTLDAAGTTTTSTFDALSRRTSSSDGNGATTVFSWDLNNNQTSLTDSDHNSTVWAFNGLDQVTTETSALGTRSFQYDKNGNVTQEIDRNGRARQWKYDNLNQQTSEQWTTASGTSGVTVSTVTHGSGGYSDMVQWIVLPRETTGGTWTLSFEGATTAPLAWDASTADVQSALAALPTIGAGNVSVTRNYTVEFVGAMSGIDEPLLIVTSSLIYSNVAGTMQIRDTHDAAYYLDFNGSDSSYNVGNNATDGSQSSTSWVSIPSGASAATVSSDLSTIFSLSSFAGPVNESWPYFEVFFNGPLPYADSGGVTHSLALGNDVSDYMVWPGETSYDDVQTIYLNGVVGGTFTLSFQGATTTPIAWNASPSDVQSALAALPTIGAGNVSVTYTDLAPNTIEFTGALANSTQPLITVDATNLVVGPIGAYSVLHGTHGPDDVQKLVVNAGAGTYTLTLWQQTTAAIAWDAGAAQVQAALAALPAIGPGNISVTGSGTAASPFLITFVGLLSGQDQPLLVADSSQLTDVVDTIASSYDAAGQLTSIGDQYAQYAYQYDGQGNVISVDNAGTPNVPHVVLNSQFDTLGNRSSLSATIAGTKDFFNSYGYDALSQLLFVTQMGQTGGNAVAPKGVGFAYNLDGQFTSVLRFDPTTASPHPDIALGTFSYDPQGRLASLNYTHLGNPIDSFGYQYDPLDRVSQFSSIDGTASYGYDKTSQLTGVVYSGGGHQPANESFQYDPNGNQTGPSPAGPNFTVGADNLLSSDGTFNLFYDAEGNLIEKVRISTAPVSDYDTKQTWDYRNRMTDVWQYNNSGVLTQHEHLVYDPFDRLIGRYIDSTGSGVFDHTELYVYDGSDVVLQFDGSGSLTNRYLNGPSPSGADQVYAEEDVSSLTSIGTVTYPLTDQQGSTRDIVGSNSVLDDHLIFSAFGQTAYESNPAVHHLEGFAGGLPDPVTGEIHFGERNLSAVDAVFTSDDPIGLNGGDTNFRRYVGNDPTDYIDPSGLARHRKGARKSKEGIHEIGEARADAQEAAAKERSDAITADSRKAKEKELAEARPLKCIDDELGTVENRLKKTSDAQKMQDLIARRDALLAEKAALKDAQRPKSLQNMSDTQKRALKKAEVAKSKGQVNRNGRLVVGLPKARSPGSGLMSRLGAIKGGVGSAGGSMIADAAGQVANDATGGRLGNFLDNTIGKDPEAMFENMKRLATSERARMNIFRSVLDSPIQECEQVKMDEQVEQMKQDYLNFNGEEMDSATENRIRDRLRDVLPK